jgi:glycosidase/predicted alpha/beta superfamily hydrolase
MRFFSVPAGLCVALFLLGGAAGGRAQVSVPPVRHPGAGQTIYFLLTDRFANGSTANDTGGIAGGPDRSGFDPARISHYHGGDFVGLTAKLDYLKNLGVTAVWVTPPFKNKPMQEGTAGYHGYWITDFLAIDPHLGTNAEYREFIRQAHARGLKVYMDIIVNHTADVIRYEGGYAYRPMTDAPYRDAAGAPFDLRAATDNGLGNPGAFPALAAARSFAFVPVVPAAEQTVKNPAWLNDVTLYHNRGNSAFQGENSVHGDFAGLDDLFTEHPRVVRGMIEIFTTWLQDTGVDGYRIDTMKHVNAEFWQAFGPAIRAEARRLGRPDFIQFGEVYSEAGDPEFLSEFSTAIPLDTTLDFGVFAAARQFVSQGGTAAALTDFFARDDYYTDHDSNVHASPTFLGNHDAGRFAYFLRQDNPGATPEQLADLVRLGHGLLYLVRGQPVIYYGDEQGMIGRGGNDMQAREDMFPAQATAFQTAPLLATTRTGADDKFDPTHPFYRFFARLGALRAAHPALRTGAMVTRTTTEAGVFACSRIERGERVEYLVALNTARVMPLTVTVPTSQPAGGKLGRIFDSRTPEAPGDDVLQADAQGAVRVTLAPLQFAVWRAKRPLPVPAAGPQIALVNPAPGAALAFTTREKDGQTFPSRQEIRAEVAGGDGFAEVTFALQRASRPGQFELLGTDDTPPYRIFWRPPADLAAGEALTFFATVNDLRGHTASAQIARVNVAPTTIAFGIRGATVPVLTSPPPRAAQLAVGEILSLAVAAEGTGPLEYQWLRDDAELAGATDTSLAVTAPGRYAVLVRNRAGTAISAATVVTAPPVTQAGAGRLEKHPAFASKFVAAREIDVWLPPGYEADQAARYPVIYMHDGQNIFEAGTAFGGSSWEVGQAVERLISTGKIRGAIVVGVWNTGKTRFEEYLPQKAVRGADVTHYAGKAKVSAANLRSDAYLRFLVEEVKPFIDRVYRTESAAVHTFIMGSSMGGLISAYALVEYPNVFGGAGCVSTHWPAGDGAVIDYLEKHLPKPGTHKFYFDFGTATLDAHYEPHQQRMDAGMRAAGYAEGKNWMTRKFPGADHTEKSWRERVEIPLRFFLGG